MPLIILAHRSSPHNTTGKSPFELMCGRKPRLPLDQEIGLWTPNQLNSQALQKERETAKRNILNTQSAQRFRSSLQRAGRYVVFQPGEKVKYRDRRSPAATAPGSRKFLPKWRGPYEVLERRGPVYRIGKGRDHRCVHGSELAKWYDRPPRTDHLPNEFAEQIRRSTRQRTEPDRLLLHMEAAMAGEECGELVTQPGAVRPWRSPPATSLIDQRPETGTLIRENQLRPRVGVLG